MEPRLRPKTERLPFPTRPLLVGAVLVEEYCIPDHHKADVLDWLYPFHPVPKLEDHMLDLHEDRIFRVAEYRVTWEGGMNWLVSPYYPESGGTVIDWWPVGPRVHPKKRA